MSIRELFFLFGGLAIYCYIYATKYLFTLQIQSKMKTVKFTDVKDFRNFQKLANQLRIFFECTYSKGDILVIADAAFLEGLGY